MNEFKVGDDLVLIRPFESDLHDTCLRTLGYKFTVSSCDGGGCISVKTTEGVGYTGVYSDRFELANKYPNAPHKHVKEMIAFAEGANIEYFDSMNAWCHVPSPTWGVINEYRIKPEKTTNQLEIERIESEMRKQAEITAKLADDLKALKD